MNSVFIFGMDLSFYGRGIWGFYRNIVISFKWFYGDFLLKEFFYRKVRVSSVTWTPDQQFSYYRHIKSQRSVDQNANPLSVQDLTTKNESLMIQLEKEKAKNKKLEEILDLERKISQDLKIQLEKAEEKINILYSVLKDERVANVPTRRDKKTEVNEI